MRTDFFCAENEGASEKARLVFDKTFAETKIKRRIEKCVNHLIHKAISLFCETFSAMLRIKDIGT